MTARTKDSLWVRAWLESHPLPSGRSPEWDAWREAASKLGKDAVPALVEALADVPVEMQHVALIALRHLGIEAWAHGYGPELHYEVSLPEGTRRIRPAFVDRVPGVE